MGSGLSFKAESVNGCPFLLSIKFTFQQGDQFVWRPEYAFSQVRRNDGVDRFQFLAGVGTSVDFCRRQIGMTQP